MADKSDDLLEALRSLDNLIPAKPDELGEADIPVLDDIVVAGDPLAARRHLLEIELNRLIEPRLAAMGEQLRREILEELSRRYPTNA